MKKSVLLVFFLFATVFGASAVDEYNIQSSRLEKDGTMNLDAFDGNGYASISYQGTIKQASLDDVLLKRQQSCISNKVVGLQEFSDELTERQKYFINCELSQYDLKVGEIYSIKLWEIEDFSFTHEIICEITAVNNAGFSYAWRGFSYYFQ